MFDNFLALLLVHWFPVPIVPIFLFRHVFSLICLGDDQCGLSDGALRLVEGFGQRFDIVPVDDQCVPSECFSALTLKTLFHAYTIVYL